MAFMQLLLCSVWSTNWGPTQTGPWLQMLLLNISDQPNTGVGAVVQAYLRTGYTRPGIHHRTNGGERWLTGRLLLLLLRQLLQRSSIRHSLYVCRDARRSSVDCSIVAHTAGHDVPHVQLLADVVERHQSGRQTRRRRWRGTLDDRR